MRCRVHIVHHLVVFGDVVSLVYEVGAKAVRVILLQCEMILIELFEEVEVLVTVTQDLVDLVCIQVLRIVPVGHFEVKVDQQGVTRGQIPDHLLGIVVKLCTVEVRVDHGL